MRIRWVSALLLALLLTGCAQKEPTTEMYMGESSGTLDIAYEGVAETDVTKPPAMQISMSSGNVASCVTLQTYGYSWSWIDEKGETVSAVADAIHPLEDADISRIRLNDTDGKVKMESDPRLTEARVSVWRVGADYDDVNMLFPQNGEIALEEDACVYMIEAEYGETGTVYYAFLAE